MTSTVTATVMFTDIVGSTELMGRVGPEVADRLRREHFDLLGSVVDAHDGRVVKNLGDGLMVVFDGVVAALDCAVAMQQAMHARNSRPADEPICIRVAISAGECDVVDGDYFGPAVVEAARLCATAEPDQIMVGELVRMLAGSRGAFAFVSLGSLELKGIAEPAAVFGVVWHPVSDEPAPDRVLPARLSGGGPFGFVGRSEERHQLEGDWKHVVAGGRRTVFLSGEPGVGKTALASLFARDRYADGALVIYGRCDEDLGIPYQPWVEVFGFLAEHWRADLVSAAGDRVTELGPFLPAFSTADGGVIADQDAERFSLFATTTETFKELGRVRPVLIVLDDLQWADQPTLQLLRHFLTSTVAGRCMVLGTFRDSEVDDRHPLADLLATLHRDDEVERMSLVGLADDDLIDLLSSAAGHELPRDGVDLAHRLRRETNGNPFFAIEILRHLAETGLITRNETGQWQSKQAVLEHGLPVSVREVVGRRVARLGEETGRVLRAASVIGRSFDLALLADVVDLSEDATLDMLDAAVAADLLEDLSPGTFGFVHALVEHALYDGLSPTRRARLHRRVAETLEVLVPDDRLAEVAHHWSEATTPQDAAKAIESARRAGDHALAVLAPDEARRWYSRALDLIESPGRDSAIECDLLIGLAEAQRQIADPQYRVSYFEAADVAERLGDVDRLARVALANTRHTFSRFGQVDDERVALLRHALMAVGTVDPGRRAQLLARLASELTYADDPTERDEAAAEALSLARSEGDERALLAVLLARGVTVLASELIDERREVGYEALMLAERHGNELAILLACLLLCDNAWTTGDAGLAESMLRRVSDIAERLEQPELRWYVLWRRAKAAIVAGDLDAAERFSLEGFEIGNTTGQPDALLFHVGQLCAIRFMQGRLHELIGLFDEIIATAPPVPIQDAIYANGCVAAGRHDDAARWLSERIEVFPTIPHDESWTYTVATWVRVARSVDDDVAARVLLQQILPWKHLFACSGITVTGPMSLYAGMLAHQLGRDDAAALLRDAVAAADRAADPFHGAEARMALMATTDHDQNATARLQREAAALIDGRGFRELDEQLRAIT